MEEEIPSGTMKLNFFKRKSLTRSVLVSAGLCLKHLIFFFFFEGLYSKKKIKTLKKFKIKNKEIKISHGKGNSLRNHKIGLFLSEYIQ